MHFLIACIMMSNMIISAMDNPTQELSLTQKVEQYYRKNNLGRFFDKEKIQASYVNDPNGSCLFFHAIIDIDEQIKKNEDLKKVINDPIGFRGMIKYIANHFDDNEHCVAGFFSEFGFESAQKIRKSQNNFHKRLFSYDFNPEAPRDLTEVDLEFSSFEGSPLMEAVQEGRMEQADWLLKHGANINAIDRRGSVLRCASLKAMKFLLLQKDLIIDQKDNCGRTALLYLLKLCTLPHGYLWQERGSNLLQVEGRATEKIEALLDAWADPEICDNDGLSPIKLAEQIKKDWKRPQGDKIFQLIEEACKKKSLGV